MLRLVRIFLSLLADSSPFKKRGFSTHTRKGDLQVSKKYGLVSVDFYQSISPFHPDFHEILDFDIPDGVFVLDFRKVTPVPNLVQETDLYYSFEFVENRGDYWFLYDKHLDFGSSKLEEKILAIETFLANYNGAPISNN